MKLAALAALTAGAFLLAACDNDPTGVAESGQVSLSVTGAPSATSSRLASSVQTTDPDNRSLVVESVRMVFFEIEFEVGDSVEGVDLKAGPIVIDLPLDGSVSTILSQTAVPPNRYEELEMEVKPVEGDSSAASQVEDNIEDSFEAVEDSQENDD